MHKYVVIGLMNIFWSKPSGEIVTNSICIIFSSILCMVSININFCVLTMELNNSLEAHENIVGN